MPVGRGCDKISRSPNSHVFSLRRTLIGLFLMILVAACATVAPKDPVSLQNAIGLKAESLALLGKAIDPPDAHAPEIQGLRQKLQAAVAYEKSKGDVNSISVEQWDLLSNPNENLLGGFCESGRPTGRGRARPLSMG